MQHRILAVIVSLTGLACGPNYRYAYEGEAAFERCYALDFESSVTPGDRQMCWSSWLQSYTYGANPDRLDYARGRLTASSVGSPSPSAAGSSGGALIAPSAPPLAAAAPIVANTGVVPAPTQSPASAPTLPLNAPPSTREASAPSGEPPGTACSNECRSSWGACGGRCAQRDASCEVRCDDGYRDCMRGCY